MLVKKCDSCKKEIKDRDEAVVVGLGWPQFSLFADRCEGHHGAFLKKRKLLLILELCSRAIKYCSLSRCQTKVEMSYLEQSRTVLL